MRDSTSKVLLHMLNKCYWYTANVLYLCVMPMQLEWTNKAAQVTGRPPKPDAISSLVLPILDLLSASVPSPYLRMSLLALLGQYPLLTMAGFPLPPAWLFPALFQGVRG